MKPYDPSKIEPKWQKKWERSKLWKATENASKKKFMGLIEFPYPSGDGLHVGHIRSNTAMDILARKRRAEGYEVLYPIGWDAFGLPTENYAIKTGIQPAKVTETNTDTFRRQLKSLGFSFDWSREVNTTDPKYYKWTQWIFLQFLKKGLAYKKKMAINWCPKDLIGLANEEVIDGKCERCGTVVEKKEKEQWMLAITKYADRLDKDLDSVDFLERIKTQQRNWIGKSEGAEIPFKLGVKSSRFVLIHGFEGSAKENFFPSLKDELERRGFDVEAPELPDPAHPKEEAQVDYVLKNCRFDEHTVIVAHSLGSIVALKLLMKLNRKISGLVLVAPAIDPDFPGAEPRPYQNDFDWKFDYDKIQSLLITGTAILSDTQEKLRSEYLKDLSRNLNAMLIEVEAKEKHFLASDEPEIIKAITPTVNVYTTRPDTLFGVTYLVLAPEHPWVPEFLPHIENRSEVETYLETVKQKTEIERTDADKEKTGVELKGAFAINPATGLKVPLWVADYVLADYGTGAVMAVPAHDDRDYAFAKKHGLPIREVLQPLVIRTNALDAVHENEPFVERNAVVCIIKHWSEDKYLCHSVKNSDWKGFVVGGIEEGEDPVQAGMREIAEETGYTNISFEKKLGDTVHSQFYQHIKKQNRFAHFVPILFKLKDGTVKDVDPSEKVHYDLHWVDAAKVASFVSRVDMSLMWDRVINSDSAYTGEGLLINSGSFNGKESKLIKKEITESVGGTWVTKFKLRDWVFSRQRYWGEPIPVVHCANCGIVPLPEKSLPLKLPEVENYKPTETGESPLAAISSWVNTTCPQCKGPAKRETDTMPNWAGSSWYYLRYMDPKNSKAFASEENLKYWNPVDWYNGGMEHTTLHLLYSRFWHKFLYDLGLVPTIEPYQKRTSHGLILAEGGEKMSKSKGNVINPDGIVKTFGADALRVYEMFMGPFDQPIAWDTNGIVGTRRFIEKVWKLQEKVGGAIKGRRGKKEEQNNEIGDTRYDGAPSAPVNVDKILHKAIKKVSADIESMSFNTAVSTLMIAVNELEKVPSLSADQFGILLRLVAPFAPHAADELWSLLGNKNSIQTEQWPEFDPELVINTEATIVIQINGKTRTSFNTSPSASKEDLEKMAKALPEMTKWLEGKEIKKVIVVPGRLINFVVA
jgi:leucyl-tRNA synthetase